MFYIGSALSYVWHLRWLTAPEKSNIQNSNGTINSVSLTEKSEIQKCEGPFNFVPNEVIRMIFGHLSQESTIGVARVCRMWSVLSGFRTHSLDTINSLRKDYFQLITSAKPGKFPKDIFFYHSSHSVSCCAINRFFIYSYPHYPDNLSGLNLSCSVINIWTIDSGNFTLEKEYKFNKLQSWPAKRIKYLNGRVFLHLLCSETHKWNWCVWDMQTGALKSICPSADDSDIFSFSEHAVYIINKTDSQRHWNHIKADCKDDDWITSEIPNIPMMSGMSDDTIHPYEFIKIGDAVQLGRHLFFFAQLWRSFYDKNVETVVHSYNVDNRIWRSRYEIHSYFECNPARPPPTLQQYGPILFWTAKAGSATLLRRYDIEDMKNLPDIELEAGDTVLGMFGGVLVIQNFVCDYDAHRNLKFLDFN